MTIIDGEDPKFHPPYLIEFNLEHLYQLLPLPSEGDHYYLTAYGEPAT